MEPQGEFERFEQAVRLFDEATRRLPTSASTGSQVQTINVNAGGWGVLIALIMVAFLAGLDISKSAQQVTMKADIQDIKRKQDRDDDYLNAIYQIAPQLKPKEK